MTTRQITIEHCCVLDHDDLPRLQNMEPTGKPVWLCRTCRCLTHGVVGVPTGALDIIIDQRLLTDEGTAWLPIADDRECVLATVARKAGMYDGRVRTRIAIRLARRSDVPDAGWGRLDIDEEGDGYRLSLTTTAGVAWEQHQRRQGGVFDPTESHRVIHWHYARYYPKLVESDPLRDEVDALAYGPLEYWLTHPVTGAPLDPERTSIAAANRAAGRALYRLFRDAGWRLLTQREKARLGIEQGRHWVTSEVYDRAQQAYYERRGYGRQWPHRRGGPGCSEATERAAYDERGLLEHAGADDEVPR